MFNRRVFASPPPAGVTIFAVELDGIGDDAAGATIGLGGIGLSDQGTISGDFGIGAVNAVYSTDGTYSDSQQIILSGTTASAVSSYLSGFTALVIYYMWFPVYSLPISSGYVTEYSGYTLLEWTEPEVLFIPNEEYILVLK